MESELEMTKARALRQVRAQRKKELMKRMERYQEEIECYQKLESSVRCEVPPVPSWSSQKDKPEQLPPTSAEEFLPKRLQASNKQTEEWCEEDDDSVSSISFQSSHRYSLAAFSPIKGSQEVSDRPEVIEPKIEPLYRSSEERNKYVVLENT